MTDNQTGPGLTRILFWSLPGGIVVWLYIAALIIKGVSWYLERPYYRAMIHWTR